jgi:flagellar hook-length control protein FliK
LALLAANSELPNSDAKKSVNLMANLPNQSQSQGQSKSFTDLTSYNSTKVTAQSLSETAQSTVEQVNQESKSVFEGTEFLQVNNEQNEKPVRKTSTGSQAENIFKSIMAQPQQASTQSVHELDISQTVQQFDTALQNAQTQQNTSMGQKLSQDPNQGQVFNLQKNEVVKALHDKVNAMLMINNKEAEIRLDPPELGSMQIRIRSEAEQAQVNFVVQNQQAKEALEESMPKLKEMLAEQGIQLGESNIQQDSGSSSEQGTDEAQELGHSKLANQESQAQNSQHSNTNSSSSESGIDYYA